MVYLTLHRGGMRVVLGDVLVQIAQEERVLADPLHWLDQETHHVELPAIRVLQGLRDVRFEQGVAFLQQFCRGCK